MEKEKLNKQYRDTFCCGCKYFDSCYGIEDPEVRASCKEKVTDGSRAYVIESPRWGEMSYYRF